MTKLQIIHMIIEINILFSFQDKQKDAVICNESIQVPSLPVPSPLPRETWRQNDSVFGQRVRAATLRSQNEQAIHLRSDIAERKNSDIAEL